MGGAHRLHQRGTSSLSSYCVSCEISCPLKVHVTILHPSDLVSEAATHAAPAAPCGLSPQRRPPLLRSSLMFPRCGCDSHPAAQRIPLSLSASRVARAKWIFRFLEGTVPSAGISLFKPSGKPRNLIQRREENERIRPTRSKFHSDGGIFKSAAVSRLAEARPHRRIIGSAPVVENLQFHLST